MTKPYKLPELNQLDTERLMLMIDFNGDVERLSDWGFSQSAIKKLRPIYNRLVKNPAWAIISEQGEYDKAIAQNILNGEFLRNATTLLWYLYDRCAKYEKQPETRLTTLGEKDEVFKWHYDKCERFLLGLSNCHPSLIRYMNTHDLCAITLTAA